VKKNGAAQVLISFINGTMGHIDLMQNTLLYLGQIRPNPSAPTGIEHD